MASIESRGDSHRVIWRYQGRKQYTSWPSLDLAEQARDIAEAHRHRIDADGLYGAMDVLDEPDEEPTGLTLRQWSAVWLPSKTRITPGTRERYEQQLRDEIYPAFGDAPIASISAVAIGTWLNALRVGRTSKTVTRYYSLLHTLMEAAVAHGHIQLNPCRATDFVRDQRADDDQGDHQAVYLTPRQYELLRVQVDHRWRPLLDTFVETGCRWSECTALGAKHLIPPAGNVGPRLRVWRAWKEGNGKRYLGATKGRSKRVLPIGVELYKTLSSLVDGGGPDTLIFRGPGGSALDYDHMTQRVWAPALLRARLCPTHPPAPRGSELPGARGRCGNYGGTRADGSPCGCRVIPGTNRCPQHYRAQAGAVSICDCRDVLRVAPSWHDLRHTHAAWLFSDPRMTPLAISRRLGHQQLATTSEIYGDLMPDAEETAVEAISDARRSGRADDQDDDAEGEDEERIDDDDEEPV